MTDCLFNFLGKVFSESGQEVIDFLQGAAVVAVVFHGEYGTKGLLSPWSFYQLIYHMVYDKSQDFTFQLMAPMKEDFTVPPKKSDHSIILNEL